MVLNCFILFFSCASFPNFIVIILGKRNKNVFLPLARTDFKQPLSAFACCFTRFFFFCPPPDALHEIFVEDMSQRMEQTDDLPAVYQTVVVRCQIAQQFYEMSKEECRMCEDMVHDQHLQMQGWSAVIANLDDITVDIIKREELFRRNLMEFLEEREAFVKLVERFVGLNV